MLLAKKVAIGHQQVIFDQLVERLQDFAKKNLSLSSRQNALVHWGSVLASEAQQLYKGSSRFLGQYMWLHLIKARLTGGGPNPNLLVEDKDLLELALRQNLLKENEQYLREKLVKLEKLKQELHLHYEHNQAAKVNIEAAGTLQDHLGDSLLSHPSYRALERFFHRLGRIVRGHAANENEIEAVSQRIIAGTDQLVDTCRSLILSGKQKTFDKTQVKDLKRALDSIDDMEIRMNDLALDALRFDPPPARPIFLKKSATQARRGESTQTPDKPEGRLIL